MILVLAPVCNRAMACFHPALFPGPLDRGEFWLQIPIEAVNFLPYIPGLNAGALWRDEQNMARRYLRLTALLFQRFPEAPSAATPF